MALYLYVAGQQLDSIERQTLNASVIVDLLAQHTRLVAVSALFTVLIAVPAGVLLTRSSPPWLTSAVVGTANVGQAVPSIGVLVMLALVFGVGFKYAVVALVISAILPVLQNTMVGLQQVDPSAIEAGRGMGMSKAAVLFRIELPLAVPVILAGIRTALIITVGTAPLAAFVDAGGLGDLILNGVRLGRLPVLLTGSVLTAVLALFVDWLAGLAEDLLQPRGL